MLAKKDRIVVAGLLLTLLATPAWADADVDETVKAGDKGVVLVENIAGHVEIVGWDRDEVRVKGVLSGDAEKVVVDGGKKVRIKVKYPRRSKNLTGGADLVINVPNGSSVGIECISAGIEISGVTGSIDAESISGTVVVSGRCEEVEAESISGNIKIDCDDAQIAAGSISGNIKASGSRSDVDVGSVSGNIELDFDLLLGLDLESVSGKAVVAADLDPNGNFDFEMHSGSLNLTLPADVGASFRVESFSGGIDNGFGQKSRRTSKYAPGRELEFSTGDGDARVRIDMFSGDVIIHKK